MFNAQRSMTERTSGGDSLKGVERLAIVTGIPSALMPSSLSRLRVSSSAAHMML